MLTPAFAPVESWLGDWRATDGTITRWVAADGAMYGVWFTADAFTIHIVDDGEGAKPPDGVLRFIAFDNGHGFTETKDLVSNELHVFSHVDGAQMIETPRAPALEAADRKFAVDAKARGAEGWRAAFDPNGAMLRKGTRVEGDAIRDAMSDTLANGTLAWEPIASGIDSSGSLGFTVGKATYTPTKPAEAGWASTYITIWRRQFDGSWKVLFDTGRVVNR